MNRLDLFLIIMREPRSISIYECFEELMIDFGLSLGNVEKGLRKRRLLQDWVLSENKGNSMLRISRNLISREVTTARGKLSL